MYEGIGKVVLKSGERVEMGLVRAPDAEWAERIEALLGHKGDPWNWQNREVLRSDVGIAVTYALLHRGGLPFACVMTAVHGGVGFLGHVWTEPEDRRKGAASQAIACAMSHFEDAGGEALFLGTWFDSPPFHIYRAHGFEGIKPGSGTMAFYASGREAFEAVYFAQDQVEIEGLGWVHWPASAALFLGDSPGVVRCTPLRLFGRCSTEGPMLPFLREELRRCNAGEAHRARVLRHRGTTTVVGLAVCTPDPVWPHTSLVDVYCHKDFWGRVEPLLRALNLPEANRCLAYCDSGWASKEEALAGSGFRPTASLPGLVSAEGDGRGPQDVTIWQRS